MASAMDRLGTKRTENRRAINARVGFRLLPVPQGDCYYYTCRLRKICIRASCLPSSEFVKRPLRPANCRGSLPGEWPTPFRD